MSAPLAEAAPPAAGEALTLLRDGTEAFPAMLDAIRGAEREVLLEMYWLDDSPVGRRFVEVMAERARAGVRVNVLYDAIGSLGADRAMYLPLLSAGGSVLEYNPIAPWRRRFRLGWVSQRDHRKILAVDGRVAFVGGLNIGQPWSPRDEGGEGWRDDVARVEGPTAERVRELFFDNWERQGGRCPPDYHPRSAREKVKVTKGELGLEDAATPPAVSVLGHNAWGARRAIRRAYLSRIRGARRLILIENAYFVPDGAVRRSLEQAARRGVEVRVILPRVSDVPAVTWAAQAIFLPLMRAGVHIHEWTRGILHAKTGLVDDWATTGSYNLDYRSLRYNLEANLATSDPSFVAQVRRSLERDLSESCEAVELESFARRPLPARARSWGFYLLRKLL
ncbi:MAG: phosphatidylserine/phosphatidylglycerophosphate/cardiolipin synthase family protein [Polyangiales bacterium]